MIPHQQLVLILLASSPSSSSHRRHLARLQGSLTDEHQGKAEGLKLSPLVAESELCDCGQVTQAVWKYLLGDAFELFNKSFYQRRPHAVPRKIIDGSCS